MLGGTRLGATYLGQANPERSIVFSTGSSSGYQASSSTYSWTHTCGLSARALVVNVSLFATGTVSSVTYNSVNLTFVRADTSGIYRNELWVLAGPAYGAKTVTVTLSTSVTSISSAASYGNVDQSAPVEANAGATGTGGTPTLSVTPFSLYAWVLSGISTANTTPSPASSQTQRANSSGALGAGAVADFGSIATPASTATNWAAVAGGDIWTLSAVALNPFKYPARTASDTASGTDSVTRGAQAFSRTCTDSAAGTDVATRTVTFTRTGSDTAAGTDSATRSAIAYVRTASDTGAGSDSATRIVPSNRSAADTAAGSDSASRTKTLGGRTVTDVANATDSSSRSLGLIGRTASDIASGTDASNRLIVWVRAISESAGGTDSASRTAVIRSRTASESASGTDRPSVLQMRNASDDASGTDDASANVALDRVLRDLASGTDQTGQRRRASLLVDVSDVAAGIDGIGQYSSLSKSCFDSASGTDFISVAFIRPRIMSPTVAVVSPSVNQTLVSNAFTLATLISGGNQAVVTASGNSVTPSH